MIMTFKTPSFVKQGSTYSYLAQLVKLLLSKLSKFHANLKNIALTRHFTKYPEKAAQNSAFWTRSCTK